MPECALSWGEGSDRFGYSARSLKAVMRGAFTTVQIPKTGGDENATGEDRWWGSSDKWRFVTIDRVTGVEDPLGEQWEEPEPCCLGMNRPPPHSKRPSHFHRVPISRILTKKPALPQVRRTGLRFREFPAAWRPKSLQPESIISVGCNAFHQTSPECCHGP